MRFFDIFGIFASMVAITTVLAAPTLESKHGHIHPRNNERDGLNPLAGASVNMNVAYFIYQVSDYLQDVCDQIQPVLDDPNETIDGKLDEVVPTMGRLVIDITVAVTNLTQRTIIEANDTVDNTLDAIGNKLVESLTSVARLIASILKLTDESSYFLTSVLLSASCTLDLLVISIIGFIPALSGYCTDFTSILKPHLHAAGVSLPGIQADQAMDWIDYSERLMFSTWSPRVYLYFTCICCLIFLVRRRSPPPSSSPSTLSRMSMGLNLDSLLRLTRK